MKHQYETVIKLTGKPLEPEHAAMLAESLDLGIEQAREFFAILYQRHGRKRFPEEELERDFEAYVTQLGLFQLRLVGAMRFEVENPMDLDETRALRLGVMPDRLPRLQKGLTLVELNQRWLLLGARVAH